MIPDLLYHYCSSDTFIKIVSSATVRLSALSLSNDSMEGKWTQQVFVEACKDTTTGRTLQVFLEASEKLPELYGGLGLCLSEKGDRLSQWRGYADDGHGFCIGFRAQRLQWLSHSMEFDGQPCELVKVEYDRAIQREAHEKSRNRPEELVDERLSSTIAG